VDVVDALDAGTDVVVEDELDDVVEDEDVEELVEDPTVVEVDVVEVPAATVVDVDTPPDVVEVVDVACGAYVTDDVVPDTR